MSGCWILALFANSVWDMFKDSLNSLTFRPSVPLRMFLARSAIGKDSDSEPAFAGILEGSIRGAPTGGHGCPPKLSCSRCSRYRDYLIANERSRIRFRSRRLDVAVFMIFAMDNIAVDLWLDVVGRATFLKLTYRCEGNLAAGRGQRFGGKSDDALRFQLLAVGFVRSSNHRHRRRVDAADAGGARHRHQ